MTGSLIRGMSRTVQERADDPHSPTVSVVIPTRGRPDALVSCLRGIGRTALDPAAVEVVVAADGEDVAPPPDRCTGAVALRFAEGPRAGPSAARNRGAAAARGEIVAFTDDDCVPSPEWLPELLAALGASPTSIVAGRVRNGLPANRWAEASHVLLDSVIASYARRRDRPGFAPSSNLAMRREVFASIGGFDERFTRAAAEDREFCDRAFERGHRIVHARAAVVDHHHDLDLRGFLRQHANYGRGTVTYRAVSAANNRRPNAVKNRFYHQLLIDAVRSGPARGAPARVLRIALSQVVYLGAYFAARLRARA
jgi:GT2 family glycosyltransferase